VRRGNWQRRQVARVVQGGAGSARVGVPPQTQSVWVPTSATVTTISDSERRLTTWNQLGGCGRVQAHTGTTHIVADQRIAVGDSEVVRSNLLNMK
jgi:hypothetical protein